MRSRLSPTASRTTFDSKTHMFWNVLLAHLKRRCAAVFVRGTFATLRPFRCFLLSRSLGALGGITLRVLGACFGRPLGCLWEPLGPLCPLCPLCRLWPLWPLDPLGPWGPLAPLVWPNVLLLLHTTYYSILLLIYIVSSSSLPSRTDFDISFLCTGTALGEGRCAPVEAPRHPGPLSLIKHICFAIFFLRI